MNTNLFDLLERIVIVSIRNSCEALFKLVEDELGQVNILVNNAGIDVIKPLIFHQLRQLSAFMDLWLIARPKVDLINLRAVWQLNGHRRIFE